MRHKTLLEALIDSIHRAADYNRNVEEKPAAILWTDHERLWEPLIAELQARLPELLVFGPWDPDKRTGPAYWLRCAVAGKLDGIRWGDDDTPVVYLPGVSRAELRQVNICPAELKPLAELQFRGAFWTQANSKDWTPLAFLSSTHGGLGLDVATDNATKDALRRCLREVFAERVVRFEGKRVDADHILQLLNVDVNRDILRWMNDPQGVRAAWPPQYWAGFCQQAVKQLKFDPAKEDPMSAADALAGLQGAWRPVWERYKEAPGNYPGVRALLGRLLQPASLIDDLEPYPALNAKAEGELREALAAFAAIKHVDEARRRIAELEASHGHRRQWVWASLGESPLAMALEHLVRLAELTRQPLTAASPAQMQAQYEKQAWQVDAAMVDALAAVREDASSRAVEAALAILYKPWLEEHAEKFQQSVRQHSYPLAMPPKPTASEAGLAVFFVDGLRYDAGRKLAAALERDGRKVALGSAWTAVPSVTASGKVLASPAAVIALGEPGNADFEPLHKVKKQPLRAELLRSTLAEMRWQVLRGKDEVGDPAGFAWVEYGDLDRYGHDNQLRLAHDLTQQLTWVRERVTQLLAAGWKRVRIVTDHGWLLVPGKLDRVELDKHLAETNWGRAAKLKPGAPAQGVTLPWTWCDEVQIAMAPGAKSFKAGEHYAHGGLSLQESLTPVLEIVNTAPAMAQATIKSWRWKGLRLQVEVEGAGRLLVDLRRKASDRDTSVVHPEEVAGGKASLVVADDGLEGESATLVVLDEAGNVLARQAMEIGGS